ncbi:MAG: hypothetical protein EBR02_00105 [Alphaproteobacteria bacterium]|nr:hypothetical protein [Alphaproteobacteria bacterium]
MSTQNQVSDQERTQLLRGVFSKVAHDLKTPLACIIGSLQMTLQMKDKLSEQQIDDLLTAALKEAHKLDAFIMDMLDKNKPA